ncbi:hypothetical protein GCM10027440_29940 [Nocardiopsis coralliicola]
MRRFAVPGLLTAGLIAAAAAPATADAPQATDVAGDLKSDHVFVEEGIAQDQFEGGEEEILVSAAEGADTDQPVYFLVLPEDAFGTKTEQDAFIDGVMDEVGDGVYAGFSGSETPFIESPNLETADINQIGQEAYAAAEQGGGANQVDFLAAVPDAVQTQEEADAASGMFGFAFLGLLLVLAVGGGFYLRSARKKREAEKAKQLAEIKQMAQEDVVRLGEDIARLEIDLQAVDDATRTDYTHAMDSYDRAKSELDTIREPDQIRQVTTAVEDGRYYMEATRARLGGDPVPERRQPCFFNPQHGTSKQDVQWAPPGGSVRTVPACQDCSRAVLAGGDPADVRLVEVDGERRPYYDAGPAYAPYAGGYFGASMMMGMFSGMMMGSMMGSMMGGAMMGGMGGDMGGGDMGDMGGGDFGGGDMDFGGGDFGGFDF